jgi:hypothetical protein
MTEPTTELRFADTYMDKLNDATDTIGRPFGLPSPLKDLVPAACFVNYHQEIHPLPYSLWPADKKHKLLGKWYVTSMETVFEAYGLAMFTRVLKMDPKEGKELCAAV